MVYAIAVIALGAPSLDRRRRNFAPSALRLRIRAQGLQQERPQQLLRRNHGRPLLAYKLLNRGLNCCSASSVMPRNERGGWSCGTRYSGLM